MCQGWKLNLLSIRCYLGIAFFTVLLAIVFYYVPLPEATNEELEIASARMPIPRDATLNLGSKYVRVIWITLGLGVLSQFCYVGGQESISTSFSEYMELVAPHLDSVYFQTIGHTGFAVSRLAAAFFCVWIKPRYLLALFYAGAIAFAAAAMASKSRTADPAMLIMALFFEGPLFPLIYAQALRGLGKHTKDAAVLLTAAIGGGAVFPPMLFAAYKARNVQYAYCVVIAAFGTGTLFPIWLNGPCRAAQELADPVRDEQARRESELEKERRESLGLPEKHRRWSRLKKRLSGSSGEKEQLPCVEHRERRSWVGGSSSSTSPERTERPEARRGNHGSRADRFGGG